MRAWRMRNSRRARAEQAPPGLIITLLLALAGCASEQLQPWPVREAPAEGRLDLSWHLPSELETGAAVPLASDYPGPQGARPWMSAESIPRAVARWSARAEARAGGRELLGSLEVDADGDGRVELVTLSRDAAGAYHLEVYSFEQRRALSQRRLEPLLHLGRPCHLEVRLLGALRTAAGEFPLLWRDRGVGCARFEGGGFERHLLVELPSGLAEIPLATLRHLEEGASDRYQGAVWKLEANGRESLLFRGIFWSRRACVHPDAGFWVEELAYRRLEPDGSFSAYRDGRALPLPASTLPPELLRSHLAPCR